MISLKVTPDDTGMRLDRLLRKTLPLRSLSDIYRLIRIGHIRVNGKKTIQNYRLHETDEIVIDVDSAELVQNKTEKSGTLPDLSRTDFFKRNFAIIYEDDDLLACNKPPNLVVHPGTGHNTRDTLIDLVKSYIANPASLHTGNIYANPAELDKSLYAGIIYAKRVNNSATVTKRVDISATVTKKNSSPESVDPVLVHRIDRDTSGIILIAKNKRMLRYLHTHFRDHQLEKRYIAVCHGAPLKNKGVIEVNLIKTVERNSGMKMKVNETGMFSKSEYSVIQSNGKISLVQVIISTGRTHQIRVHLAHIGCPIIGDVRYGDKNLDNPVFSVKSVIHRLYLHAERISFIHPIDGKRVTLIAPLPEEFRKIMKFYPISTQNL
jgi:RluA family pseudouridine synthase